MVADTIIYFSAAKNIQMSTLRSCFIAIHVCSGKIRFPILSRSEKPVRDIMAPSLVSEAQVIQWQCHNNNWRIPLITRWDFEKKSPWREINPPQLPTKGLRMAL